MRNERKFPYRTLIGTVGVVVLAFIIYFFVYKSGSQFFPSLKIDVLKLFKFESGEVVGPFEKKFSIEFDDQSLAWAVNRLDRMASDVNIILHDDIVSGKVRTKPFNIHLNGANLSELLDAYCVKAAVSTALAWRQEGKNVFVETVR